MWKITQFLVVTLKLFFSNDMQMKLLRSEHVPNIKEPV